MTDKNDILNQAIVDTIHEPLLVMDESLKIVVASKSFFSSFHVTPSETIGRPIQSLGNGQWNIPILDKLLLDVLNKHEIVEGFEVSHEFDGIGKRVMKLNARKVFYTDNNISQILLVIEDITEQIRLGEEKREFQIAKERLDVLHATMRTVADIVNNALNSYQYIKLKIKKSEDIDPVLLEKIGEKIQEASGKLKKLGDMMTTPEKDSSGGKVIDYE